jgi:hypothetical protein
MNVLPLTTLAVHSLADAVDETLAGALAGRPQPCLWCGGGPVRVTSFDFWAGEVTVVCPECGSELSGAVIRHQLEVPA